MTTQPVSPLARPAVHTDVWTTGGRFGYVTEHVEGDPTLVMVRWTDRIHDADSEVSVKVLSWGTVADLPTVTTDADLDAHNVEGRTVLDCALCYAGEPMIHNYEKRDDTASYRIVFRTDADTAPLYEHDITGTAEEVEAAVHLAITRCNIIARDDERFDGPGTWLSGSLTWDRVEG